MMVLTVKGLFQQHLDPNDFHFMGKNSYLLLCSMEERKVRKIQVCYLLIQDTHFISLFSTLHYIGIEPVTGVASAMLYQFS